MNENLTYNLIVILDGQEYTEGTYLITCQTHFNTLAKHILDLMSSNVECIMLRKIHD